MRRTPYEHRLQEALSTTPEAGLARARSARQPAARARYAREGLAVESRVSETRWLLLRQLYLAHAELGEWRQARDVTREMVKYRPLCDIAWHDWARAALGESDWQQARAALRRAWRTAPPSRTFEHAFALARLQAQAGAFELALAHLRAVGGRRKDKGGCMAAAELVWDTEVNPQRGRAALVRAYVRLEEQEKRPLLADFFAAELLRLLGKEREAEQVYRQFLAAVADSSVMVRTGLTPEIHVTTHRLGATSAANVWFRQ